MPNVVLRLRVNKGLKVWSVILDIPFNTSCITLRKGDRRLELKYNYFMYSLVSVPSGTYPLPAMHSLLVTLCDGILLIEA